MSDSWPPPSPPGPESWPPPQGQPTPYVPMQQQTTWTPQKTAGDHLLEWSIPINRSGLAVAAGYIALVSLPIVVLGPFAVFFGILALADLRANPQRLGRGRAWFAIVYGGFSSVLLIWLIVEFFRWGN